MAKQAKKLDAAATLNNGPKTIPPQLKPFQPGNTFGKGRPKGSRNKLGEDFLQALQADFSAHGVKAIETVREERPHEYLKVIAGILPKELNVNTSRVEELSDDELADGIAALQSILASQTVREGSEKASRH